MVEILTKTCFSPQSEPHTADLCSPVVFKQFLANSLKTSLFSPKIDYLSKEHWTNYSEFFFS